MVTWCNTPTLEALISLFKGSAEMRFRLLNILSCLAEEQLDWGQGTNPDTDIATQDLTT